MGKPDRDFEYVLLTGAFKFLWIRLCPVVLAVTDELFLATGYANSLCTPLILIGEESKLPAAADALRNDKFRRRIAFLGKQANIFDKVFRVLSPPPFSTCVNGHKLPSGYAPNAARQRPATLPSDHDEHRLGRPAACPSSALRLSSMRHITSLWLRFAGASRACPCCATPRQSYRSRTCQL